MALEIPLDLINQLQISLRKEAGIPSFDPNDSSLPPPSDSIAEGDPSPPNLLCKHCKVKLLRGAKSVICAYCGRHQTREGALEPINFRSSSGCRWFLQSLELEGSEAIALKDGSPLFDLLNLQVRWNVEAEKLEASISDEDYFFPRKSSLSSARVDDETFFPERKGGTVLAVPEGESMENKDVDAGGSDDFEDLRKPSLFENALQSSGTVLSSTEEKSGGSFTGWEADFQGAGSGTQHEVSKSFDPFVDSSKASSANLSPAVSANNLFDAKEKENSTEPAFPPEQLDVNVDVKADGSKTLDGDFDSSDGWDEFKGPADAGDAKSANDMKSMDMEEKKGDTLSGWETGLQSTIPKSKPEESSFIDPFVGSSVDLSAHIDGVFGSGKDLFDGKSNANTVSSSSNSSNWFADDLWSNATPQTSHQADNDKTAKGDGVTVEYPSSEAVGDTTVSQDYDSFGDWDDFKGSSTLADGSTSSSKEAKPANSAEEKIGDSFSGWEAGFQSSKRSSHERSVSFDPFLGSSPDLSSQMDSIFGSGKPLSDNKAKDGTPSASITSSWLEGDLWSNPTSGVTADKNPIEDGNQPNPLHTSSNDNEDDDFFDSWNAYKSSAQAANDVTVSESTSKAEKIDLTDGETPKTADLKTSDKNNDIFDSWNDFTSSDVAKDTSSSPSKQTDNAEINPSNNSNLFSGGISNQNGSSDINIMPGEASLSNRMADPSVRDSKDAEVPGTSTTSAKSSDLDAVMSQMHDLSFMLENDLSIPPQG